VATPEYVPEPAIVQVRTGDFPPLPPPRRLPPRPADVLDPPREPGFGAPGPDPGYGFLLGALHEAELVIGPGEHRDDAHWAVAAIGVRRAARAGRAPISGDIDFGRSVLGYDGRAPEPFVRWRTNTLSGMHGDSDMAQWLADTVERGIGVDQVPGLTVLDRWWASLAADEADEAPGPGSVGDTEEAP
jgi:hypothetical protein